MSKPDYTQLIREQYTVLQAEHLELRRQYDLLLASSGGPSGSTSSFPGRLLELAKSLQHNAKFADCEFVARGGGDATKSLPAHRFLLATRSRLWQTLESGATVEVAAEDFEIFETKIYRWIYEDRIELGAEADAEAENEERLMRICEIAAKMKLDQLMECTIAQLSSRLNPSNCIRVFEFAELRKFEKLAQICTQMVSANWQHFSPAHFAPLSAPIIYRLISKNTQNVLKNVIDIGREDVLFLFFMQNSENLRAILNATWQDSSCALETCLMDLPRLAGIGGQLIEKGANVDLIVGKEEENLLMRAIRRDSLDGVRFLKEHAADLMYQKPISKSTVAHILAQTSTNFKNTAEILEILKSSEVLLNQPDSQGRTPLQIAVLHENFEFCRAVLRVPKIAATNFVSRDEHTALSLAVLEAKNSRIAELLILNGADLKALRIKGTPILNILLENEENLEIVKLLLDSGVDFEDYDRKSGKTAIHLAVENGSAHILSHIFGATKKSGRNYTWHRDSGGKTALDLAVEKRDLKAGQILIEAGAPINEPDSENLTLLAKSILAKDDEMAVFLIDHGAKAEHQNGKLEKSYLELSCESGLLETVRSLISTGLRITPNLLELALLGQYFEVADLLVQFGCPLDSAVLHKFLDLNDQPAAIFLIRAGCDVATSSRDIEPAIHVAVAWSMLDVLRELVARDTSQLIAQDANGRTAAHLAVREQNYEAMEILLSSADCDFIAIRDKFGQTILSQAMIARDHRIAAAIVERQPHAAAQTNGNGENLLHSAIRQNDFEAVLFLLAVARIDVGRPVQDGTGKTPLHLAAVVQNEMIIRNLILASEDVNSQSADGCTPLHDALKARKTAQARILLENRADPAIRDEYGENGFLCAVRSGDFECVKLIQAESRENLKFERNKIGMTCLHLCALLTPEKGANKNASMEICELLLRNFTEIDKNVAAFIDAQDADGNTALMIAYSLGNAAVCRSLLRRKASMGTKNNGDVNLFTYETATKQLLLGLLESLECEPRWSDSDTCDCGLRFSLTQRKHHCRHCGRHVCAKCSETTMPIAKYGEEKRVRVCDVCSHVISGKR